MEGDRLVEREVLGVAMAEVWRREISAETLEMKIFSSVLNGRMRVDTVNTLSKYLVRIVKG